MEDISRLQVGIDISRNRADMAMLRPTGEILEKHHAFDNSMKGYLEAKFHLLTMLQTQKLQGIDIAVEATSYYWLPLLLEFKQDVDLATYEPRLAVLNASWVKWFKKSSSPGHKSDQSDPYYIAEHLRTMRGKSWWQMEERWLALRLITRFRFHLVKSIVREKNYYQLFLFLAYSRYNQVKPFSDDFGDLSQHLLKDPELFEYLAKLPEHQLAQQLDELSNHQLGNPYQSAVNLKKVHQESFRLVPTLQAPVREVLERISVVIRTLEDQKQQLNRYIAQMVRNDYPEVDLLKSIPGVGVVYASSIAAEIAGIERFFGSTKWDKRHNCYRKRNNRDAEDALAKYAGLWWPRSASGGFEAEELHLSKKGNAYLRYSLIEAVDHMRLWIPSYSAYYAKKYTESNKHAHKRALVLTARKSVGLYMGLLHHQVPYEKEVDKPVIARQQPAHLPKAS